MRISDAELKKLLVDSGLVKEDALNAAQPKEGEKEPLQALVIKKKMISEKDLAKLYAKSLDVPFVELGENKIPREILLKIPERIARKYQVVLFGVGDDGLQLAMADPEDFQAADFISKQVGGKVRLFMATAQDIAGALEQYKGNISSEITKAIKDSSADATASEDKVSAKDLAEDAPIAKTVNVILEYAVKSRASDIHIEPRENIVQVRYRIDGVLRETMTLPKPILAAVVSRIKILSNLKIDEHRVPQDGRFKFTIGPKTVALRVSTLPIMDGEKIVMRILDESARALTLGGARFCGARPGDGGAQLAQATRYDFGDRSDRLRQVHYALFGAKHDEQPGRKHLHGRGPGRIPCDGREPDAGEHEDRYDFCFRPQGAFAPRPQHHHGRRDP
jgi:type IV pilus assembly protein PilB